jgi:signal transduction histidine kinase
VGDEVEQRMTLEGDERARIGALAHELNNHLTAIRLTAELCESKLDDRERVERGLQQIRELAQQSTRVTDELLRLGRPSAR